MCSGKYSGRDKYLFKRYKLNNSPVPHTRVNIFSNSNLRRYQYSSPKNFHFTSNTIKLKKLLFKFEYSINNIGIKNTQHFREKFVQFIVNNNRLIIREKALFKLFHNETGHNLHVCDKVIIGFKTAKFRDIQISSVQ